MFVTLNNNNNNNNNNTILIDCIKYIVTYSFFFPIHMRLQCVTLTTREGDFILRLPGQEDVCIGIGSRDKV